MWKALLLWKCKKKKKTHLNCPKNRLFNCHRPTCGTLGALFSLSFCPIKYFSTHHKLYIIWKLKTSKFILWKPFWNRTLRYYGNGTLKSFGGLLPLSGRCQVSYYTMYYGLLESQLFIILTKYISSERSDSQDSICGGLFVIGVILTEKFRHLWLKNALKKLNGIWMAPGGYLWYDALNKISQEPIFFISTSNLEHNLCRHKAFILYQF